MDPQNPAPNIRGPFRAKSQFPMTVPGAAWVSLSLSPRALRTQLVGLKIERVEIS